MQFGCLSAGKISNLQPATFNLQQTMKKARLLVLTVFLLSVSALAADPPFNGLDLNLGNLPRISKAKTRSISPENFTGEKGKAGMSNDGPAKNAARDLGQGWK